MTTVNGAKMGCALLLLCAATALASSEPTLTTLLSFDATDGTKPNSLVQGLDGNFYGTTAGGGSEGGGTLFRVTSAGKLTTIYSFPSGSSPGGLILGADGNLYGVTGGGGHYGFGTVFKITFAGQLTSLYSFCGHCADGGSPNSLIRATNGHFYGTTSFGSGTVFEVTSAGEFTTLHTFDGTDGEGPFARLVEGTNGNFYGTTWNGGAYGVTSRGNGTVFEITPAGKLTTLHSFHGPDGQGPLAGLVEGTNGSFYGTTKNGGTYDYGTVFVFEITPAGKLTLTTLHSFDGMDGRAPEAVLVRASDGNLYGTTAGNGPVFRGQDVCDEAGFSCGTVFRIDTEGSLTTLHRFSGWPHDGASLTTGLVVATDGNLYGTTAAGAADPADQCTSPDGDEPPVGCGTIFGLDVRLATHFSVTAPTPQHSGQTFKFIVTARDAANDLAASYAGTVHFSSSDANAALPANSTLTGGMGVFSATLQNFGRGTSTQTITATDTITASITGTSNPIEVFQACIPLGGGCGGRGRVPCCPGLACVPSEDGRLNCEP